MAKAEGQGGHMEVDARIAQNGVHFIDCGARGVAFVLSHQQIKILVAVKRFGTEERACLRNLCFHGYSWRERQQDALSPAQRASHSRSIRRLETLGLVRCEPKIIEMTPEGAELLEWLLYSWRGWPSYTKRFAQEWPAEITAPLPSMVDLIEAEKAAG